MLCCAVLMTSKADRFSAKKAAAYLKNGALVIHVRCQENSAAGT